MKRRMNGSAPPGTSKFERETTAAEISVIIPQEAGVFLLARAIESRPPNEDRLRGTA